MKNTTKTLTIAIIILIATITTNAKEKIGVFDSRAIAISYFNSDEYRKEMQPLYDAAKKAKESKDTIQLKKLNEKGALTQKILHDKGFGRGSVAEILEKNSEVIRSLAKKENLSAVVSKWELLYLNENLEIIDITIPLLKELGTKDNIIKMYEQMKDKQPVENAFFIED